MHARAPRASVEKRGGSLLKRNRPDWVGSEEKVAFTWLHFTVLPRAFTKSGWSRSAEPALPMAPDDDLALGNRLLMPRSSQSSQSTV